MQAQESQYTAAKNKKKNHKVQSLRLSPSDAYLYSNIFRSPLTSGSQAAARGYRISRKGKIKRGAGEMSQ